MTYTVQNKTRVQRLIFPWKGNENQSTQNCIMNFITRGGWGKPVSVIDVVYVTRMLSLLNHFGKNITLSWQKKGCFRTAVSLINIPLKYTELVFHSAAACSLIYWRNKMSNLIKNFFEEQEIASAIFCCKRQVSQIVEAVWIISTSSFCWRFNHIDSSAAFRDCKYKSLWN